MKAISLWQPWASLWPCGLKVHETRHWRTDYRGPLLVHAAKRVPAKGSIDPKLSKLVCAAFGNSWRATLPYGSLVGLVELIACQLTEDDAWAAFNASSDSDLIGGNWRPGRYIWRAANPRLFSTPIPWKGERHLFEVPHRVIAEALCQGAMP